MSIPRRGFVAAGLAVSVVGSLGFFALNATAEEVADPPPAEVVAEAPADPDEPPAFAQTGVDASQPPELLPWGEEPDQVDAGPAGATSRQLAALGADIAPKRGPRKLVAEFSPKGLTSKRTSLGRMRTNVAPQPPAVAAQAAPKREVNFHYAGAYQIVSAEGTYANLVVGKPKLATDDYHTLAEIAVQAGPSTARNIVEVGWTVDRNVNEGSNDPHLFVYHWVDGKESCYNACGFVQYSRTVFPGDKLAEGTVKRMGIQFFNGAWWIAFDSEWVGYFPGALWNDRYTRTEAIQWFGEVASSTVKPCSGMGTGVDPKDEYASARLGTINLLNSSAPPSVSLNVQSPQPAGTAAKSSTPVYAGIRTSSARTVRYGGPGAGAAWGDDDGDGADDNPDFARCRKLLP